MTERHTLMAVFAHPDDEAFGTGGTLTRYAAEGHDVYLVTATRGEAGLIQRPGTATPANLPQVREHELRCACQAYGIHPPRFLDYVDGQLPTVHQGQTVGKVVRLIRCHATQVAEDNHFGRDEALDDPWFRREAYILARSTVPSSEGIEQDLPAGLD
jgi:LmbE family N-acetylglucosaminyl deacetylase